MFQIRKKYIKFKKLNKINGKNIINSKIYRVDIIYIYILDRDIILKFTNQTVCYNNIIKRKEKISKMY